VLQSKKALSSLTLDDALAYRDFLADPQPAAQWLGLKGVLRFTPLWRPFAGPLRVSSQKQSLVILHGLFEWLLSTRYTTVNPFAGVRIQGATRPVAGSTTGRRHHRAGARPGQAQPGAGAHVAHAGAQGGAGGATRLGAGRAGGIAAWRWCCAF
jgi:hypothetical protein